MAIEIKILKPLYGQMCFVRETFINQAKKKRTTLLIITPEGVGEYTPTEWLKGAKKMEKVFLFKDNPMILWGNYCVVGHKPKLTGKAKKEAEWWDRYHKASEEERFKMTH